jgi:hypothetical protein
MIEYIPYFAALITIIFAIGFILAIIGIQKKKVKPVL